MSYISSRAKSMAEYVNHVTKYLKRKSENPFHKTTNPQGIINMGISENKLTYDLLEDKLKEKESHLILKEHMEYFPDEGLLSFREAIADFLNYYMKPVDPILAQHLIVSNGCTALIDCIAHTLADEGEGFLVPAPYYGAFLMDLQTRARVVPFSVELSSKVSPGESQPFELSEGRLESALKKAQEQGVKIRGLLLCNPNNPLGVIYSVELLQTCLAFAARHSLHVIMDEIYMLCGLKEGYSVNNILSLKNIPDKERLHVLWGFSKDFGMSGFRCGVLHTRNKEVYRAICDGYAGFHNVPTPTQVLLTNFIKDKEWLDSVFIPANQHRLRNAYKMTCDALLEVGIPFLEAECSLFVWVDFRELVPSSSFEEEMQLFECMLDNGVFFYPGSYFCCPEPGWFRFVFAVDVEILQLALSRLQKTVKSVRVSIAERIMDGEAQNTSCKGERLDGNRSSGNCSINTDGESLEELIRGLHRQIKDSDWLQENTAEKWAAENPELAKAFLNQNANQTDN
ncbi:1-aminocyclopropane-1-carboxylate synthase-like protein 1 isoform X1 [Montipora foliosa]|uniref:1-aminocyclopropane-1-carboxylate synthase-like protein 1 isoform X1 n=1 Tax=Montipora foliosa TaxID=591990 RepID=UPI0035F10BD0